MRKTENQMIDMINEHLEHHNQTTRILTWTRTGAEFSNGVKMNRNDSSNFKRRIFRNPDIWARNVDRIFSGEITIQEIKSLLAAAGGKSVQKKYGDEIRQNLNTGIPWNKGIKTGQVQWHTGLTKETDDRLMKLSLDRMGEGNPMYGVKHTDEYKREKSVRLKELILSGQFTPNSNNRNTHWESTLDGKKYRSSWEALYQYINQNAEYEVLRVKYQHNEEEKVYIVDFVDHHSKTAIEVKPSNMAKKDGFADKIFGLNTWAKQNGYTILIVDENWLIEQNIEIDYNRFDENTTRKIKALYATHKKN
jgi:very-short-patch-repair endonuclease